MQRRGELLIAGITFLAVVVTVVTYVQRPKPVAIKATPVPVAEPQRLVIPKLMLDALIDPVGLDEEGRMANPAGTERVAWYKLGPRPGLKGNAVIAGHLDDQYLKPAVFSGLGTLRGGDDVYIGDSKNKQIHFRVTGLEEYEATKAPLAKIFGDTPGTYLNLITCAGKWDYHKAAYNKRLVVYTQRVP